MQTARSKQCSTEREPVARQHLLSSIFRSHMCLNLELLKSSKLYSFIYCCISRYQNTLSICMISKPRFCLYKSVIQSKCAQLRNHPHQFIFATKESETSKIIFCYFRMIIIFCWTREEKEIMRLSRDSFWSAIQPRMASSVLWSTPTNLSRTTKSPPPNTPCGTSYPRTYSSNSAVSPTLTSSLSALSWYKNIAFSWLAL